MGQIVAFDVISQVRNYYPGYIEQAPSRGYEASPQSGLGVRLKLCSSSKKLRGLSARAQARRISIPLLFPVLGVSSFLSPLQSAAGMSQRRPPPTHPDKKGTAPRLLPVHLSPLCCEQSQ